jgi:hypothetical protein
LEQAVGKMTVFYIGQAAGRWPCGFRWGCTAPAVAVLKIETSKVLVPACEACVTGFALRAGASDDKVIVVETGVSSERRDGHVSETRGNVVSGSRLLPGG